MSKTYLYAVMIYEELTSHLCIHLRYEKAMDLKRYDSGNGEVKTRKYGQETHIARCWLKGLLIGYSSGSIFIYFMGYVYIW